MQTAEILLDVIQKRGIEGKPLERLYRKLFNKGIYRLAYSRIYANQGALTPGIVETDTLDGMSEERMDKIIKKVKTGNYRWNPVRRTHIPKPKGGKRPLGIPSGEDKLLQAALKILIETYYEPQFSERSHGFRPNRGCHTALNQINQKHRDVSWFIEGDIKGCFDNIDHDILLEIMGEKIKDQPLLRLLKNLMKSGYVEDWKWGETLSGTPQGGIISPLLSNIYMDKFDRWVEKTLLPDYNFGQVDQGNGHKTRRINPEYKRLSDRRVGAKRRGDKEAYKHYGNLMRKIPTRIDDENYRKLEYIRYADDFLLSFKGPKKEAEEIREKIKSYLKKELKLELSIEKTLITHAKTEKAKFLGYNLRIMQSESRRKANGAIWYGVPREVIGNAIKKHKKKDKITHRNELIAESDYSIISQYQAEYRGLVQFYTMAHNLDKLKKVEWVMGTSL
ncbi:MAG: hypothetical protein F4Y91_11105, partial [Gemmatimonadetes bacterium]|nr:hypothetical protein [Gemmatimonadota bacterium]